jgi:hypothetical protein
VYVEPEDHIIGGRKIQHRSVCQFRTAEKNLVMTFTIDDVESRLARILDCRESSVPTELESIASGRYLQVEASRWPDCLQDTGEFSIRTCALQRDKPEGTHRGHGEDGRHRAPRERTDGLGLIPRQL